MVAAVIYYGSYIAYWFNPHDEGGTAAVTAMRLLDGEVPIRDVELGYNIGWFLPIVLLFKIAGVNFLAMRGYFFALSTLTALLGWHLTRKVTNDHRTALLVGLALVIFPGSQFKNYIPLITVANMLCVVNVALTESDRVRDRWIRMATGGLVLGLTLLIRIDLGYLFALLWMGSLVLHLLDNRAPFPTRLRRIGSLVASLSVGVLITWLPMQLMANSGGYGKEFAAQYEMWVRNLSGRASAAITQPGPVEERPISAKKPAASQDRTTLQRVTLEKAISGNDAEKTVLFILTHAPPLIYALLLGGALFAGIQMVRRGTFSTNQPPAIAFLLLIGSMAAFPQFFFFRPDRPHLSEFMPGFTVAATAAAFLSAGWMRRVSIGLIAVQFGLFAWYALDHYSAGTIAARTSIKKNKRALFNGANGVRVWVHKEKDLPELEGVLRTVQAHSKRRDWLVCYPYQPGYNLMTDRPTYLREIYQDNATVGPTWSKQAVQDLQTKKPKVVIVDNREINHNAASRFSSWGQPVYSYLQSNYEPKARFGTVEIFCRTNP